MSTKISHRPHRQMSESFLTAGFLSLSGGLQDAYTYMSRGKVFANAQTGNIVLLSQSIGSGDWPLAIHYLVPLLSGNVSLPLLYTPDSPHYAEISACIDANDEICKTYPSGYQLFIKGQLFLLFYILLHKCSTKEPSGKDRSKSLEKMKLILKYVENNYMEKITIEDIANEVGLSQSHFMKYFKNTMGTSFVDYLNEYRLTMASRLLISSDSSILAIASEVGFENLSYFNRIFKKRFGQTPREYRRRQSPA